jgi:glycine cleavage system H protein
MAKVPKNLLYTNDHEWVKIEGGIATVGITDHAQDQLGDIVFLGDTPEEGEAVEKGDVIGVVESVKATSDIYSPVEGTIHAVNEDLEEEPEVVNSDPYGRGWIVKIKLDGGDAPDLLSPSDYEKLLEDDD